MLDAGVDGVEAEALSADATAPAAERLDEVAPAEIGLPPAPAAVTPAVRPRPKRQPITVQHVVDELVAWAKTLASAAVYATLIVTYGFQVARVEGQSMAPTLIDQDRLIVNKFSYQIGAPRRGDIVMLYFPRNPDKSYVKRVIAEEGDTVQIIDGKVFVNGTPMNDDFIPAEYRSHEDWPNSQRPEYWTGEVIQVTRGERMSLEIAGCRPGEACVIPDGYYFVMGDHRNSSSDSREWGLVPKKYIIGKVQVRWWPLPKGRMFE